MNTSCVKNIRLFSLIEIVCVIVLVAILSAIAVGRVNSAADPVYAKAEITQLVSHLRFIQAFKMNHPLISTEYSVTLSEESFYTLTRNGKSEKIAFEYCSYKGEDDVTLSFDEWGILENMNESQTFLFEGSIDEYDTITIEAKTGFIHVD